MSGYKADPGNDVCQQLIYASTCLQGLVYLGPRVEDEVIQDLGEDAILRRPPRGRIISCTRFPCGWLQLVSYMAAVQQASTWSLCNPGARLIGACTSCGSKSFTSGSEKAIQKSTDRLRYIQCCEGRVHLELLF